MSFLIYFDEANKIDQPGKEYSYYGAYGGIDTILASITRSVRDIHRALNTRSELHFREYNHDQYLKKYFKVLNHVINQDVNINILVVSNTEAQAIAQQMNLSMMELRNLFYIKIPERLFYGVTRHLSLPNNIDVKISVDRNDEYRVLRLYSKIKEQMNAHSVYRNKRYTIQSVRSQASHESVPLQIIDTFMGIVVFLMEQGYAESSDASLIKSDLIYRFLSESENTDRFQKQIKLFRWEGNETLSEIPVSNFLSKFMAYKTKYDIGEMIRLQSILLHYPNRSTRDYRKLMEYPNTRLRMLLGYKDEIEGRGRNSFLLT
ncbi:DUF3800 domain-containing protein [Paenibacillus doosanensis]|uniref:DUF3800 domain-containing protein n=1 Tax=Paenibacillus doosanensis TaxID=1229154 RepID=UPI0021805014|nr:DUF3800 domain-containing protein [Paenibacillus doosanensis]MCS7459196.1 DUF3800 domain-containing protein [Paenibacillus doosanensis]